MRGAHRLLIAGISSHGSIQNAFRSVIFSASIAVRSGSAPCRTQRNSLAANFTTWCGGSRSRTSPPNTASPGAALANYASETASPCRRAAIGLARPQARRSPERARRSLRDHDFLKPLFDLGLGEPCVSHDVRERLLGFRRAKFEQRRLWVELGDEGNQAVRLRQLPETAQMF